MSELYVFYNINEQLNDKTIEFLNIYLRVNRLEMPLSCKKGQDYDKQRAP